MTSKSGDDVSITLTQNNMLTDDLSVLDNNYTITLTTVGGLQPNTRLFAGFLQDDDVTRDYRVNTPYISNPYETMDKTSRDLARRFTAIGGPSFYVSFLGQDTLQGELIFNVSFDPSLDWSESEPKLAYWDIGVCVCVYVCVCVCVSVFMFVSVSVCACVTICVCVTV